MIVSNQAKCRKCGDIIFSATVHDYKSCKCGAIFVDGGQDYLRRGGDLANFKDMSITVPDEVIEDLKGQLEWCRNTGRNDLGVICAFFRTLRDNGYDLEVDIRD